MQTIASYPNGLRETGIQGGAWEGPGTFNAHTIIYSRGDSLMSALRFCCLLIGLSVWPITSHAACNENLDFTFKALAAPTRINLCEAYAGKVVLVVNTASKCGYTHQYDGLESLYKRYKDRGLVVLGFPSNDFGQQEPGNEKQIQSFCRLTYGVKFPMFEKVQVTPGTAHPFFQRLATKTGEYPGWNFHKYLLDRDGNLIASLPSRVEPESRELVQMIEKLL